MAELNANQATTTDMTNKVDDFEVSSLQPDGESPSVDETFYDYNFSDTYFGYYKEIPELKKAIDALATWTVGKGFETDLRTKNLLQVVVGWGEDSIQSILWNLQVMKKVLGDSFAEIIRNDSGDMINLKPLYAGDMRVVVDKRGIIKRYEQRTKGKVDQHKKFKPEDILHLVNDRVANEIHGTSVVEAVKWVIDARNEALRDEKMIKHRELALGVLYVDTDNQAKRDKIMRQYEQAVKKGEVLVLPKDTAELKGTDVKPQDRLAWIQYLENFFYQAVGVPRVIATSENFTEAASKVGYLTFEPIYVREQTDLEADIWNKLGLKITFNRPPSLAGVQQESEEKNTGQLGFQDNEKEASIVKNE